MLFIVYYLLKYELNIIVVFIFQLYIICVLSCWKKDLKSNLFFEEVSLKRSGNSNSKNCCEVLSEMFII